MAINFPNSPADGDTHIENGLRWTYSSTLGLWQDPTPINPKTTDRNLLYNGDMQVAQRGTTVTGRVTGGYLTCDRWLPLISNQGTWTINQTADGPAERGFSRCLEMICTTADASPAAGDFLVIQQRLEGQDLQRLAKGKSGAKSLTISFSVKSNLTGTYIVGLFDLDNSRIISKSYTINAANTWETKTITFPGDTTGFLDSDNDQSLIVDFWLGGGSNFTSGTLSTSWSPLVQANRAVGQVNLAAATSNYFRLTGVQLEEGTSATAFDHLPYEENLARCQRYYEVTRFNLASAFYGGGIALNQKAWAVEKRTGPTLTLTPDAGTGGTIAADSTSLFYQSTIHSQLSGSTVTGNAELQ